MPRDVDMRPWLEWLANQSVDARRQGLVAPCRNERPCDRSARTLEKPDECRGEGCRLPQFSNRGAIRRELFFHEVALVEDVRGGNEKECGNKQSSNGDLQRVPLPEVLPLMEQECLKLTVWKRGNEAGADQYPWSKIAITKGEGLR